MQPSSLASVSFSAPAPAAAPAPAPTDAAASAPAPAGEAVKRGRSSTEQDTRPSQRPKRMCVVDEVHSSGTPGPEQDFCCVAERFGCTVTTHARHGHHHNSDIMEAIDAADGVAILRRRSTTIDRGAIAYAMGHGWRTIRAAKGRAGLRRARNRSPYLVGADPWRPVIVISLLPDTVGEPLAHAHRFQAWLRRHRIRRIAVVSRRSNMDPDHVARRTDRMLFNLLLDDSPVDTDEAVSP